MRARSLVRLGAAAAALAVAVPEASAQTPSDSSEAERPEVTVPLPNGRGIFYYRAGDGPGGIRIRSTTRPATPTPPPEAEPERPVGLPVAPPASGRVSEAEDRVTRLDLLLLERNLLDALDRRLAALDRGTRRAPDPVAPPASPPVIVLPGQTPPPAVAPPAEPTPAPPLIPAPTPIPTPVPAPPSPGGVTVEEIERAILDTGLFRTTTVNFEFARATLLPVSERTLDALVAVLLRYPDLRIEVGGHTDNVGSDATNDRLSQRRAESVVDYLAAQGVGRDRLSAVGFGERRPVAANDSDTGRALNRRVEFVVLNPEAAERARRTVREAAPADTEADLRRLLREELERLRREQDG